MKRKGDLKYLIFFLTPSLIFLFLFQILPITYSLMLSFMRWNIRTPAVWIGLGNYTNLFHDKEFWLSVWHTFQYILMYVPLVIIGGMILALLVNKKIKFQNFFKVSFFIPVISSWVAVSLIWKGLLNPKYGFINQILSWFGIKGPAWLFDPGWAMTAIVFASVWKDVGFIMVILLGGLSNIPKHLYEASVIDGATPWKQFWRITLPLLTPTLFFALMITLINSFQIFDQVWIMTNGGPAGATSVIVERIYRNAFSYSKMGYAAAMSWFLFALIFGISFLQNRYQKKWVFYS
nr:MULTISPECIES: sugar ABC transporter permease [Kosmotoga]